MKKFLLVTLLIAGCEAGSPTGQAEEVAGSPSYLTCPDDMTVRQKCAENGVKYICDMQQEWHKRTCGARNETIYAQCMSVLYSSSTKYHSFCIDLACFYKYEPTQAPCNAK